MPFSTLRLSAATVGMAALGLAIAAPASAQESYMHPRHHHRDCLEIGGAGAEAVVWRLISDRG